jgi:hypothetical protein
VVAATPAPKTVAVRDATGDARGDNAPDIVRTSLGRGSDGRLRATITLAGQLQLSDLLAEDGPPGSVCLRLWTGSHRPSSTVPDYLVCATVASDNDALKASVLEEREGQLPAAAASASASKPSARTVVVRFGQSAIGRPSAVRFGVEARPAGCNRVDCVDTAPDAPKSARLAIR